MKNGLPVLAPVIFCQDLQSQLAIKEKAVQIFFVKIDT